VSTLRHAARDRDGCSDCCGRPGRLVANELFTISVAAARWPARREVPTSRASHVPDDARRPSQTAPSAAATPPSR